MGRIVEGQNFDSIKKEPDRIVKERVISAEIKLPWYINNPFLIIGAIIFTAFVLFLL